MWKNSLLLLNLLACAACQAPASSSPTAVSAGALTAEYQRSSANARSKYDGKVIVVRGFTETAARMPQPGDDQGSVSLKEKENDAASEVTCWFSREQMQDFAKIASGHYITVKGVFNGEGGANLKFCRLLEIRSESQ